jgi:hypothetical protein
MEGDAVVVGEIGTEVYEGGVGEWRGVCLEEGVQSVHVEHLLLLQVLL